jgi:Conserved oligomeric complex COG6
LPQSIELHAHDPMRYVDDMLAWVHQVIAAEREFLKALSDGRMAASENSTGTLKKRNGSMNSCTWITA